MKRMRRNGKVFYLPEEIIRNILKRLPVKSLLRFQCVCKDWKNLMKNPSFIADHLQQYSNRHPSLLFECYRKSSPRFCHLIDGSLKFREIPLIDSLKGASIVGSCNGLLCVEIDRNEKPRPLISLWNPMTSAVRHVPESRTDYCFDKCVTGFGFSPIVNDYMIVRIYYAELCESVNGAEVFSLRRGSWEGIDITHIKVKPTSEIVTVNGSIYWSGYKQDVEEGEDNDEFEGYEDDSEDGEFIVKEIDSFDIAKKEIVSFDIANQVFTVIPMPDFPVNGDAVLAVYKNQLAVLSDICKNRAPDLVDLWVLDDGTCESGDTWRWIKRYDTSYMYDSQAIWRNEIVSTSYENDLCLLNLTTNKLKRFVIPNCGSISGIYNYVESLVSVGDNYIEES